MTELDTVKQLVRENDRLQETIQYLTTIVIALTPTKGVTLTPDQLVRAVGFEINITSGADGSQTLMKAKRE